MTTTPFEAPAEASTRFGLGGQGSLGLERMQSMVESMPVAVILANTGLIIDHINPASRRALDHPRAKDPSRKIEAIQSDTGRAVQGIAKVGSNINQTNQDFFLAVLERIR